VIGDISGLRREKGLVDSSFVGLLAPRPIWEQKLPPNTPSNFLELISG